MASDTKDASTEESSKAKKSQSATYKSARGWSIRFQPEDFEVKFLKRKLNIIITNIKSIKYVASQATFRLYIFFLFFSITSR